MRELSRLTWCAVGMLALVLTRSAMGQNEERRPCVAGLSQPGPENTLDVATSISPASGPIQVGFNLNFPHRQGELLVFPAQSGPILAAVPLGWQSLWDSVEVSDVQRDESVPMFKLQFPTTANLDAVARDLLQKSDGSIASIEANSCVFPQPGPSAPLVDPESAAQWGHWRIGLEEAWKTTTGSSSLIVAVIDSGINHENPDLTCNFWTNPCDVLNGADDDCPGRPADGRIDDVHGWNFALPEGNRLSDEADHGTKIAGIIGACQNEIGVVGTNWSISLMDLRYYDTKADGGALDAILKAFVYATQNGAHVINASWDVAASDKLKTLIHDAPDVIVVTGAGNRVTGEDLVDPYKVFPCNWTPELKNLICVTASVESMDAKLDMANYGAVVQIAAPGDGIWTTEGTGTGSGTGVSFAVPYAAGVVALVKAQFPLATTGEVVRRVLCGDDVAALAGKTQAGTTPGTGRRLNAAKALTCDSPEAPALPADPKL